VAGVFSSALAGAVNFVGNVQRAAQNVDTALKAVSTSVPAATRPTTPAQAQAAGDEAKQASGVATIKPVTLYLGGGVVLLLLVGLLFVVGHHRSEGQ
jgi:hypothetical protein